MPFVQGPVVAPGYYYEAAQAQGSPRPPVPLLCRREVLLKRTAEPPSLRSRSLSAATFRIARVMTTPCWSYACVRVCVIGMAGARETEARDDGEG